MTKIQYTALIWSAKRFAMLEGICATLNLCIDKHSSTWRYKAVYLFEGFYFGAIMGIAKIAKIKCL